MSKEPNKIVEFDEVVSSVDDNPTVVSSSEEEKKVDSRMGQTKAFGGSFDGRFGQVYSMGRKAPWWLWPLLFIGIVLFLILGLVLLVFVGIPLAIIRMLFPKKAA